MKVYVDELLKDCIDCPCESEYYCNLLHEDVGCLKWGEIHKNCPLQSLVEHDKQVRKEVLDKLCDMLSDRAELIKTGSVAEFMFTTYDLKESINEILGEIQEKELKQKKFTNYSGWDLINDLVKPCRVCGVKPTICDLYGYPEKYQIACMQCNCTNRDIASDDNFYTVIDLWNKTQGE